MGCWLARIFVPDVVLLLLAIACAQTVMIKHLPDHIFGHAHGEIIGNDTHQGNIRDMRIMEDMIHTSAQRKDNFQVRQIGQGAGLLLPHKRIFDVWIILRTLCHDIAFRCMRLEAIGPGCRVPIGYCEKNVAIIFACHCLTPPGVASMWKAAAINAFV